MINVNMRKSLLVTGLAIVLSLPLLNSNYSAQCNATAGDATVIAITNSGLPAMTVADDLQGSWAIFEWKIWGYVGQAVDVAGKAVQGWEVGKKVLNIIRVGDEVVVGIDASNQMQQKVLIQELD